MAPTPPVQGPASPPALERLRRRGATITNYNCRINACQVATGSNATFGGYVGLATAFLTAGARGVVAPLWNI
jgi:hypothetical protein